MFDVTAFRTRLNSSIEHQGKIYDMLYREPAPGMTGFLDLIPDRGYKAGEYEQVDLIYSGNTSAEIYTENAVAPNAGQQTVTTAKFTPVHFRVTIRQTSHARRYAGPRGEGLIGKDIDLEFNKAVADMRNLMEDTYIGTGAGYLQGIVDNSTAYGDIARATYTATKSYEASASSAAISSSVVNAHLAAAREEPYKCFPQVFLSSNLQVGKWNEVMSGKVTMANISGASFVNTSPVSYIGSIPLVPINALTNSVLIGLTDIANSWHKRTKEWRPGALDIKVMGPSDDSDTVQISTAMVLWCTAPEAQFKLTTLSTG
jgi:hypothetical protein